LQVRVLPLHLSRLRVESLGFPMDQRRRAVRRSMLLVSGSRLIFVLLSQPRLFDGEGAFRVSKGDRTLMGRLTPTFRTHDGHETIMPPPASTAQSQRSRAELALE
jgi:hypothetical protein